MKDISNQKKKKLHMPVYQYFIAWVWLGLPDVMLI